MITLEIHNTNVKMFGPIPDSTYIKLDNATSYKHAGYLFVNKYKSSKGGWDGVIRLIKRRAFPIGLLERVKSILDSDDLKYIEKDMRRSPSYGESISPVNSKFEFRPYQKEALESAIKNESGVVKMATGSGKTFTLSSIVAHYNVKTMIYVIGVELMYQMHKTLKDAYGIDAGLIGDGKCDIKKINIATIWSAASAFNKKIEILDSDVTYDKSSNKDIDKEKVRRAVNDAELLILDECQYAAASTVQFLHRESKSTRHRFLFSASPWRDTGDDILIEAVGGPKIFDLDASSLIKQGYLVKPHIYFVNVPSMRGIGKTYQEVYKNYIVENDVRNDLIKKSVKKLLLKNKKILILVVRINHGKKLLEALSDDFKVEFLDGKKSSAQRLSAIEKMKSGEVDVLIASKIFDQGIDIPELDALILAGSGKSTGRALQRIGRVIRKSKGKDKAIVVEFFDHAKYLRNHSESRMSIYRSEPEFKIIKSSKNVQNTYVKRKNFKWI